MTDPQLAQLVALSRKVEVSATVAAELIANGLMTVRILTNIYLDGKTAYTIQSDEAQPICAFIPNPPNRSIRANPEQLQAALNLRMLAFALGKVKEEYATPALQRSVAPQLAKIAAHAHDTFDHHLLNPEEPIEAIAILDQMMYRSTGKSRAFEQVPFTYNPNPANRPEQRWSTINDIALQPTGTLPPVFGASKTPEPNKTLQTPP